MSSVLLDLWQEAVDRRERHDEEREDCRRPHRAVAKGVYQGRGGRHHDAEHRSGHDEYLYWLRRLLLWRSKSVRVDELLPHPAYRPYDHEDDRHKQTEADYTVLCEELQVVVVDVALMPTVPFTSAIWPESMFPPTSTPVICASRAKM